MEKHAIFFFVGVGIEFMGVAATQIFPNSPQWIWWVVFTVGGLFVVYPCSFWVKKKWPNVFYKIANFLKSKIVLIQPQESIVKNEAVELDKPETNSIATTEIKRDVWLLNAVHYIAFNSWDFVDVPLEDAELTAGHRAQQEIKQRAFDGDLPIWGKVGESDLFVPIDKEYWEFHYLGPLSFLKSNPEEFKTEKAIQNNWHLIYNSLMTSKAKVEELWPKQETKPENEIEKPDINMSKAIDYVVKLLLPDKDPNVTNIDTEIAPITKLITEKLRSGELKAWGKRIVRVSATGTPDEYKSHSTGDILFKKEDWEYRKLLPLEAGIPREDIPQTESFGSGEDNIQLTALKVNSKQLKKIKWQEENI